MFIHAENSKSVYYLHFWIEFYSWLHKQVTILCVYALKQFKSTYFYVYTFVSTMLVTFTGGNIICNGKQEKITGNGYNNINNEIVQGKGMIKYFNSLFRHDKLTRWIQISNKRRKSILYVCVLIVCRHLKTFIRLTLGKRNVVQAIMLG